MGLCFCPDGFQGSLLPVLPPRVSQLTSHFPKRPSSSYVSPALKPMVFLSCPGNLWMWNLICALWMWSLLPQSCGAPSLKPCWPSIQIFWGFFLLMPDLQGWGPWTWVWGLTPAGEPVWYTAISSSLWIAYMAGMGFDHDVKMPPPAISLCLILGLWI